MKILVLLSALFSSAAIAGVPEMVAQCEAVMRCDVCRITNDTNPHPSGHVFVSVQGETVARVIPLADYNWLRNAGSDKQNGRYVMCMRVEEAMKDPNSSRGYTARSMFNANWKQQDYCPR